MLSTCSVDELHHALQQEKNPSVIFLDVRTPEEYAQEHIAGVQNIPLDDLSTQISFLQDKTNIYLHCRSGGRSLQAAVWLRDVAHVSANVMNVDGGIEAWKTAGYPVVYG